MSPSYLLFVFIAICAFSQVFGDIYMQEPRGCNDRLNENGDRNNDKRLFNSENNARGGYCWGPELTYYEGSKLSIEWTAQHACGNDNTKCNIVLQYMCSDEEGDPSLIIRDGLTTATIPTSANPADGTNYYNYIDTANGKVNYQYGMNEPLSVYTSCVARQRNQGLFVADRGVSNNQGAMATRQNNGGTRYGFECTEEHDYYPYWHPSVWKDIAVLVDNKNECDFYQRESQNVKGKNWCNGTTTEQKAANNEVDCAKAQGVWAVQPAWKNIDKPDCLEAPFSRDNHLGNGVDGHTNGYNWTIPRSKQEDCIENGKCACVLRIRYNITVGEVTKDLDARNNSKVSPVKNNPTVTTEGQNFTLALNTAQTGRTFQDRSFMFRIAPRPDGVSKGANIYNLNVRGKRGNIVQTYPATEYDFVPTFLEVDQNDFIHFQWTGCDTNPGGNNGEGKDSTDRSNIVQIKDMTSNYPLKDSELANTKLLFKDDDVRKRMAMIDQANCKSYDALMALDANTRKQDDQNCFVLNNAPTPRFDGGLVQMKSTGTFSYMSTRNNNFSNRSQKGSITVKETWKPWKTAVIVIGGVAALGVGAAAGTVFYAKRHPLSKVAEVVHKVPGLNKV